MHNTRIFIMLASFVVLFDRPSAAQTPTFTRIDTAPQLSLNEGLVVGDFDRDGFPDLILKTHSLTEPLGLHFLRGHGDGTFANSVQVFSDCCSYVGAGDFDGDGNLDLVVGAGESVVVLPGKGDGTFGPLRRSPTTAFSSRPPLIADFNRDGKLDVAVAHQDGGVSVSLGNGDGTFGAPTNFPIGGGSAANGLVAGDFNGDGILDIAASNPGPPNFTGTHVSVLIGNGDGTFGPPTDFTVGVNPFPIATADFNGDDKVDVAVANYFSNSVSVLLGQGDGTFRSNLDAPDGPFPVGLGAADFNGDGKPDAAVGSGATSLAILLGNGDGTLGAPIEFAAMTSTENLAVADFNADGKPDVLILYLPEARAFSVFLNTTMPDTTAPTVTASADPSSLWPPNGRLVPVTLTGTILDTGSGVDPASATFTVKDEYGLAQPSGSLQLNADGSYRVQVPLTASRQGSDGDGRTYTITVSAKDKAGNLGSAQTVVRVPHDRGDRSNDR